MLSSPLRVMLRIDASVVSILTFPPIWLRPRLLGYAQVLGVAIDVSDIGPDGKVTVSLA